MMVKKILLGLALIFVVIQFFGIDTTVPETDPSSDFLTIAVPATPVATLIEDACYDCHSHKTEYPWYSNVAPVSWWVQDHIDEGREHLNFSAWADYSSNRADHKLEEAIEMVEDEEMPLPSFTWTHSEARLTGEQRALMISWFNDYRTQMTEQNNTIESEAENSETSDNGDSSN